MSTITPTELLTAALAGLEQRKAEIESQLSAVRLLIKDHAQSAPPPRTLENQRPGDAAKSRKNKLSPAAIQRISAAQKRRWREWRKAKKNGGR